MTTDQFAKSLIKGLEDKASFHQNNGNDPHDVSTAVYVALSEVAQAIKDAQTLDMIKSGK